MAAVFTSKHNSDCVEPADFIRPHFESCFKDLHFIFGNKELKGEKPGLIRTRSGLKFIQGKLFRDLYYIMEACDSVEHNLSLWLS